MKLSKLGAIVLSLLFCVGYGFFVLRVNVSSANYSDIIVATTFFFSLFTGFFITRQNDRYSRITEIIAERDGLFSFLYRVYELVPRVQAEIREAVHAHYTRILQSNDWAYNEFHPSDTIARITHAMGSITPKEAENLEGRSYYDGIWDAISQLQQGRKKIIAAYQEKLTGFQWAIVIILGVLLVISFTLVPGTSVFIQILKILFGTAVFISVILLKQLDDLRLFGAHAGEQSAKDIFRILDERDAEELGKEPVAK